MIGTSVSSAFHGMNVADGTQRHEHAEAIDRMRAMLGVLRAGEAAGRQVSHRVGGMARRAGAYFICR